MSGKFISARNAFGQGKLDWTDGLVRAQLLSDTYEFNENDSIIDAIPGQVGDSIAIESPRVVLGWARCAKLSFEQVKGSEVVAIIFFRESDGLLIEYHRSVVDFPIQPNGGGIDITIPDPGIFRI